jgi:hypothetical protein
VTSRRRAALTVLTLLAMTACANSPSASPTPSSSATPEPTATPTPVPTPEPTPTPLLPDNALLPNLVMEPLDEWHVEVRDGRRLLRVTTIFSNYGVGAFDLRGGRANATDDVMLLDQIVFTDSGGMRRLDDVVEARYAGDGHDHWHAQGVVTMALSPVGSPASVIVGEKIHFCFFDNVRTNEDLDEFRPDGYYTRAWCGTPESMTVRMGLSIGWGDRYGWDFPYQQIDITGLAGGTYELRATVDVNDVFVETDDTDNCTMSRFVLPGSGTGQIITVEASEQPC